MEENDKTWLLGFMLIPLLFMVFGIVMIVSQLLGGEPTSSRGMFGDGGGSGSIPLEFGFVVFAFGQFFFILLLWANSSSGRAITRCIYLSAGSVIVLIASIVSLALTEVVGENQVFWYEVGLWIVTMPVCAVIASQKPDYVAPEVEE